MRVSYCLYLSLCLTTPSLAQTYGSLTLSVIEETTQKPLSVNFHFWNTEGKGVRVENYPWFKDHIACDGQAKLELPQGNYTYSVEHGSEYTKEVSVIVRSRRPTPSLPTGPREVW